MNTLIHLATTAWDSGLGTALFCVLVLWLWWSET